MGFSKHTARHMSQPTTHSVCSVVLLSVFLLSTLLPCVSAYNMEYREDAVDKILFRRLAEMGEIHIDRRAPPAVNNPWLSAREIPTTSSTIMTASVNATVSATSTITQTKSTATGSASKSASTITASGLSVANSTASRTATSASTSIFSTPSSFPTPFDTSLGNNFTSSSCPTFFNNRIINNSTFDSCAPASLLLQNSMAFFKAARSASYMNTVLDNSCSASLAICSPLMSNLADSLIDDANCGADYRRQNPIVIQAYAGLLAYEPLYNATCLENKITGNYCFTDAITNSSNAGDLYPYYTALGLPLSTATKPTCNSCLQRVMSVFAGYAQQKEQPLSKTYTACAQQVDGTCGASFANTEVKVASVSGKNAAAKMNIMFPTLLSVSAGITVWLMGLV